MSADRAVRWSHGVVIDWTLHLTRGLPEDVARDRFAQIVSDLWEQEHGSPGRSRPVLAISLLRRMVRGMPSDLAWRHGVLTGPRLERARIDRPRMSRRSTSMTKKHPSPAAKPWVHLIDDGAKPFDQTNGAVDFDVEDAHDASNPERDLLEKGVAANTINVGFGGGF